MIICFLGLRSWAAIRNSLTTIGLRILRPANYFAGKNYDNYQAIRALICVNVSKIGDLYLLELVYSGALAESNQIAV